MLFNSSKIHLPFHKICFLSSYHDVTSDPQKPQKSVVRMPKSKPLTIINVGDGPVGVFAAVRDDVYFKKFYASKAASDVTDFVGTVTTEEQHFSVHSSSSPLTEPFKYGSLIVSEDVLERGSATIHISDERLLIKSTDLSEAHLNLSIARQLQCALGTNYCVTTQNVENRSPFYMSQPDIVVDKKGSISAITVSVDREQQENSESEDEIDDY